MQLTVPTKPSYRRERRAALAPRARLGVECLEDRVVPSWAGVPPTAIAPPSGALQVVLNSQSQAQGNAGISGNEVDYFSFTARGTGNHTLSAVTPSSNLDPVLGVFNASGQRVAYNDDISSTNTDSRLSINLTAGARYYFGITNYSGTGGGNYTWSVAGPASTPPTPTDDSFEENDSFAQAYNLGTLSASRNITGLKMADSQDWFRFALPNSGTSSSYAAIAFQHAQGDLDMRLYDAAGNYLRVSDGVSNSERIALSGLAAGTYYLQVYGYRGVTNPSYSLEINPGATTPPPPGGPRVLYLHFDGASLSRSDLVRYAGSDWSGNLSYLDAEGNGIAVQSFVSSRADREQVISQILSNVQTDLNPFGLSVRRLSGPVVENQGATTIFVGQDNINLSFGGVAGDVDFGNNNRTDIAFARPQATGSSAAQLAQVMADLILHEAGHTFGLYHVNSPNRNEAMGNGYSAGTYLGMNVAFLNEFFPEYLNHGSNRGPQNSYQVMYQTFVTGALAAGSSFFVPNVQMLFHADGGVHQWSSPDHVPVHQQERAPLGSKTMTAFDLPMDQAAWQRNVVRVFAELAGPQTSSLPERRQTPATERASTSASVTSVSHRPTVRDILADVFSNRLWEHDR